MSTWVLAILAVSTNLLKAVILILLSELLSLSSLYNILYYASCYNHIVIVHINMTIMKYIHCSYEILEIFSPIFYK